MQNSFNRRQLLALCFVNLLAPATRLMPRYSAELSGAACWLAPIAALPFLLLYILFISRFMRDRRDGEGLGEVMLRAGGRGFGSAALIFAALLQIFFSGFFLLSGANRFISTIYPASGPAPFIAVTLLIALIAALGPDKAIVRSAKIFAPIIIAALALVLIFAFVDADLSLVAPVTVHDAVPTLKGVLPVIDVFAGSLLFPAFLECGCRREGGRCRDFALWCVPVALLLSAICAAVIANYGVELTAELAHPFFTLIRDVTLFRTIERIEALVAALWVLPDFVVLTVMLKGAGRCLRLALGFKPETETKNACDLSNGRWLIAASALAAGVIAFAIPVQEQLLGVLSEFVVPAANLVLALLVLPALHLFKAR